MVEVREDGRDGERVVEVKGDDRYDGEDIGWAEIKH